MLQTATNTTSCSLVNESQSYLLIHNLLDTVSRVYKIFFQFFAVLLQINPDLKNPRGLSDLYLESRKEEKGSRVDI